jgi:hypothetical protein
MSNNLIEIKYFEVLAGTTIKDAVGETLTIAKENDCVVKFDFNGVEMTVYKWDNLEDVINYYYKELNNAEKND